MKHKSDRTPGKYDVLLAAKELAGYTLRLTANEDHFPKRYRFSVVNKLQDKSLEILDCLLMAQEIYPNTPKDLDTRILYMKQARAACRSLMTLMEVAANTFRIEAGTFRYWTGMVIGVRNHTSAWIKADLSRFANLRPPGDK